MKPHRCLFCDKLIQTPYHVTDLGPGNTHTENHLCQTCGDHYLDVLLGGRKPLVGKKIVITSPQQLFEMLMAPTQPERPLERPCECGWSGADFERTGRFGCPRCYDHFRDKMERSVFPYHQARSHVGKVPRNRHTPTSPDEVRKHLRLLFAQAVELEQYEQAAELKRRLDALPESTPQ